MTLSLLGVLFAVGALVFWSLGDYFIQRSVRLTGIWPELFLNSAVGLLLVLPFALPKLIQLFRFPDIKSFVLLSLISLVTLLAAVVDFKALKIGKLAIVEPIFGLELPITVGLALSLAGEKINFVQALLILLVFIGVSLAATRKFSHSKSEHGLVEKGVILAILGAITMALMNFLVGYASKTISPFVAMLSTDVLLFFISVYIISSRIGWRTMASDLHKFRKPMFAQAIFDNAAWLSFAISASLIPISITTTISESYIAFTVLAGLILNKETLRRHQLVGVCMAVAGIIVLVIVTT